MRLVPLGLNNEGEKEEKEEYDLMVEEDFMDAEEPMDTDDLPPPS